MSKSEHLEKEIKRIKQGGAPKYHQKAAEDKKLFVRERLRLLLDPGFDVEDARFANNTQADLPADGVVTGIGQIEGKTVCYMANDSTIKAGSWGWRTVEKIIRIQETAAKLKVPMLYLVDSAGARITDQIEMFPGRRGAGRIFHNQIAMSGYVPQVCLLFGPSAAGGAYIPAFCDIVIMNDDLRRIPEVIRLSRRTRNILLQNIVFALGIKAVFLVLAVFGNASMWMAVFADMGASLLVVINGLRLLGGVSDKA